jgi:uncharacterized protein YlxW (UPF0749 family)
MSLPKNGELQKLFFRGVAGVIVLLASALVTVFGLLWNEDRTNDAEFRSEQREAMSDLREDIDLIQAQYFNIPLLKFQVEENSKQLKENGHKLDELLRR